MQARNQQPNSGKPSDEPPPTSFLIATTPITNSPTDKQRISRILGQIIDRTRIAKGWNPYDDATQKLAVQTWYEILNTGKIPPENYDELYRRACVHRARCLEAGKQPPEMSAELMLAQWSALRDEIEQERINNRRILTANAKTQCPRCFGTGYEYIYDNETGKLLGIKHGKCEHRELIEGEWLFKRRQK